MEQAPIYLLPDRRHEASSPTIAFAVHQCFSSWRHVAGIAVARNSSDKLTNKQEWF
jgi:hypothetical protein